VVLALYFTLAGCSAHRQAQTFYASLETQDFPSISVATIDAETARLHALRESTFGSFFAAISGLRSTIKPRLMEVAERPINGYRTEQDRAPATGDWLRAHSCLNFATEIDSSDKLARAELDLVDGHLATLRKQWVDARQKFVQASSLAPDSPDPWIALAALDAYQSHNLTALLDDQNKEQQRHYTLAEREAAQRGDVSTYLARKALGTAAVWRRKNSVEEETRFLREADSDFDQAQKAYEGCRGWFHTENAIEQIHKQRDAIQQRLAELTGGSQ
jgi:tetratricopeptide (TPR) repeat protein